MREALAHSDHDFVVAEPRSRRAAPRRGFVSTLGALLRLIGRLAAYPNRILGALVFALTIAILVNALMLQHSRHPAPLFRRTVAWPASGSPAPAAPAPPAAAPAPVAAPPVPSGSTPAEAPKLGPDPITQLLKSEAPAAPVSSSEPEKKPAPHRHLREGAAAGEAEPAGHDPITHLLNASPAPIAAAEERPKTVLAVQQALVKLGFVVRPDGQMGAVTRHAIEQYERDHGLPVEARLTPKLLHRLAAETGIAIE